MAERAGPGASNDGAGQGQQPRSSPADSDLLALPAGSAMHEYRIDRVLGSGGFGITYLAHDTHLDCPVAIKEYLPRDTAGRGPGLSVRPHSTAGASSFAWGLDRFLQECRALASFHHPGIVRVLRYFTANDTAYMVMEYESGEPLDRWLASREPVDAATLHRIVRPLLDGLETIHNAGFLHRDIKPRNIYMRVDGSPVLLDFGSARRLGTQGQQQLLTAVVTPGFAPAEQYLPDGKQGPWSDLYSLAGVMYWLVTGHLPTESLARLREDPMPAAAAIGRADVYGKAMLRAIDWALTPDENLRPRRVADFRRACLPPAGQPVAEAACSPAVLPTPGSSFTEGCSFIGAVLFSDVCAAPTPAGAAAEAAHKEHRQLLAMLVSQAVAGVPANSRLAANTREGCAVCYVGDPEDALRTASRLSAAASERGLGLYIGINLGPVRVQPDPGGRSRLLGDGVASAFRVMRFAEPGQVLVSAAYVDLIAQLRRRAATCFTALGQRRDPQDRVHDLYLYVGTPAALASQPITANAAATTASDLTPAVIEEAERVLTAYIGPMARILVRKTLPRAGGRQDLHRLLAEMISDPPARSAFLAALTHRLQQPAAGAKADSHRPDSPSSAAAAASLPAATAGSAVGSGLAEADCERIGRILARHIGPLAKILLRREAASAADVDSLCRALASQIDSAEQRAHFLREVGTGQG
ncbi:protein kinase [Accumulibacter sp.]|uniref:protein kinase domain-containing protein n=1 Tax=Accumulibacter sp. TaxID=2053492 RepID=UPI0025DD04C8|nr:protein kinase [Accumulibacter sp.]MCM8614039.1 protein kinase [Accumulibacter sp.]MCM8637812.1 protein kinase [Accumulibacter sp.]MCM8641211.1 protein kinase [Accumulibacter sp.]